MNGKERILKALRRQIPDTVPVFEWFIDARVGTALTGSADPLDIAERLDLDAVNVRPDYQSKSVGTRAFVDEWGIERRDTGDVLPAAVGSPIADICTHATYDFPDPTATHRFATFEKALQRVGHARAVILNLRDGFSDLRDLLGYEGALMALLLEPKKLGALLDRAVAYNLALAQTARRRYGAEIVVTTDDIANATGMLMRPETYFDVVGPRFQEIIRSYKDLGYLCIKHCDGNIDPVVDFWIECGIDCLDPIDPGGGYTMAGMKQRCGSRVCLKGNIDCTGALCNGQPDDVAQEVRACLAGGASGGGMILSSSNTIHRGVKPENFRVMIETARQYGRYDTP